MMEDKDLKTASVRNVLVGGFGNLLQRDDGFGVLLLRHLQNAERLWPANIHFVEIGIGGITLVHELQSKFDALIVFDAIEGETPGQVKTLEISPADQPGRSSESTENDFHHQDRFADIHYAEPGRAIALAHEVGALPEKVYMIGCVPRSTELGCETSPEVKNAIAVGAGQFEQLLASLCGESPSIVCAPKEIEPTIETR